MVGWVLKWSGWGREGPEVDGLEAVRICHFEGLVFLEGGVGAVAREEGGGWGWGWVILGGCGDELGIEGYGESLELYLSRDVDGRN